MDFKCNHCGSSNTKIEEKGTQVGLYCCDCGKWIKWLSKQEVRVFNSQLMPLIHGEFELKMHDEKIRADERAKVLNGVSSLINQRLQERCNKSSCDDCEQCCEASALDWLERQLKEQGNE